MSDAPPVLEYALRRRKGQPAWQATEAWLALLPNVTLLVVAAVWRVGGWEWMGVAMGLFLVAFALILTVVFVAACGVFVAYVDGPPSAYRRRTAWAVLAIALAHAAFFVAVIAGVARLA